MRTRSTPSTRPWSMTRLWTSSWHRWIPKSPSARAARRLAPGAGRAPAEAEMRAACQHVLQLFDDASDRLPEKYFLRASELLKRLFLYAEPRESLARIKFVARALHAVFQATSNMSAEMAREISALKAKETAHELEAQKLRNLVSQLRGAGKGRAADSAARPTRRAGGRVPRLSRDAVRRAPPQAEARMSVRGELHCIFFIRF